MGCESQQRQWQWNQPLPGSGAKHSGHPKRHWRIRQGRRL